MAHQSKQPTPMHSSHEGSDSAPRSAFVVVDFANIACGARDTAVASGRPEQFRIELDIHGLLRVVLGDRQCEGGVVAGSSSAMRAVGKEFGCYDMQVEGLELGRESNTEQGVDATLRVGLNEWARSRPAAQRASASLVLLTGDGAGFERGTGFGSDLLWASEQGIEVECWAWEESTHTKMRRWLGSRFRPLNPFFDQIVKRPPERIGAPRFTFSQGPATLRSKKKGGGDEHAESSALTG